MPIPVVWSPETRRHEPMREVWVGVPTDGTEVPERVDRILDALAGHELVEATPHDDDVLRRVHDPALRRPPRGPSTPSGSPGPYDELVGQDRVVPYVFPTPAMTQGMPPTRAAATHGRAGQFGYDTMTLVGPGTWEAARAAVDCALTAVDLVAAGGRAAYALCRPPGHHATRDGYGGSCYLNNAAVAAEALRDAGHDTVAVVDLDAHHGNGTQAIFWDAGRRALRLAARRPRRRLVPPLLRPRRRDRRRRRRRGHPQPPAAPRAPATRRGSTAVPRAGRVRRAAPTRWSSRSASTRPPTTPRARCRSPPTATPRPGRLLGSLGLPRSLVQEGGYHLDTIGGLVAAYLDGHG